MKYTIRPVTASDAPALAAVLMSAWQSDPHWAAGWNYATLEQMTAWSSERTPYQLISDRATKRHQMAVSTETGEIVGYARWELPPSLASQDAWLEARVADVGEEEREGYKRRFEGVDEKEGMPSRKGNEEMFEYRGRELEVAMKRMEEEGPFLTLENLVVAPKFQRQGIAKMLLRSALQKADQYGVRAHTMAAHGALKMYENFGFNLIETVSTDYSIYGVKEPYGYHLMVREPVEVGE